MQTNSCQHKTLGNLQNCQVPMVIIVTVDSQWNTSGI